MRGKEDAATKFQRYLRVSCKWLGDNGQGKCRLARAQGFDPIGAYWIWLQMTQRFEFERCADELKKPFISRTLISKL
jgi:hypothetical protein